jgi:predicted ATP-grasp superfamily ATP-dependent carboligase
MTKELNRLPVAIVLGCHKLGLGVIRALGQKNILVVAVYYNSMDMGYASRYVVARYKFPHPDHDERAFVESLIGLSNKWNSAVIIPCDDATLIAVSKNKNLLESHFKVAASDWEITEICINKIRTHVLAEKIGVACPKTVLATSVQEAKEFVKVIGFPCLLKPSVGHSFFESFRKKMLFIEDWGQFEQALEVIEQTRMKMMVQEFIPGNDTHGVNYNSYFIDGFPKVEITAEKVRLSPPQIGFPRVVISKYIPEVIEPGRKILNALKYSGFSCMEFKRDEKDGIYKLMEINCRQNLSTLLSVRCGINFPYLTYMHVLKGDLPEFDKKFSEGIYWIDAGKDFTESIRSFRKEHFRLREYIKPYLSPHVFSIPSKEDPFPFIKRSFDLLKAIPKHFIKSASPS